MSSSSSVEVPVANVSSVGALGAPESCELPSYNNQSRNEIEHLTECKKHISAEYWAYFEKAVNGSPEPGWRNYLDTYNIEGAYRGTEQSNIATDDSSTAYTVNIDKATNVSTKSVTPLPELQGHLCIYRENLFFTHSCKLKCGCDLMMEKNGVCRAHPWGIYTLGMCFLRPMLDYPDPKSAKDPDHQQLLYSLGYCEDYFKAFRLLDEMKQKFEDETGAAEIGSIFPRMIGDICHPQICRQKNPSPEMGECWRSHDGDVGDVNILNNNPDVVLCKVQRSVVNQLRYPVEYISGPPGTGKTSTICAIVRERVLLGDGMSKTLIVTSQNKALDVLVNKFVRFTDNDFESSNMGMYVVGSSCNSHMGPDALMFTMDALLNRNLEYVEALKRYLDSPSDDDRKQMLDVVTRQTKLKVLNSARVIFSTVSGLCSLLNQEIMGDISNVIVDEASMLPEWQAALLGVLSQAKGVVFVGDVKQLSPFTLLKPSNGGKKKGKKLTPPVGYLDRAETCLKKHHFRVPMLTRQFRMHPDIASLVSDSFYGGRLVSNQIEFILHGKRLSGINWLDYASKPPTHRFSDRRNKHNVKVPAIKKNYVDSRQEEVKNGGFVDYFDHDENIGHSYVNATEVYHIVEALKLLAREKVLGSKSVSVICFYKKQVELIEAELERENNVRINDCLANASLRILTVDASQGSEAAIVILSVVRSNAAGEVGFLRGIDGARRICVALSRACEALVIVGNTATLAQCRSTFEFPQLHDKRPCVKVKSNFDDFVIRDAGQTCDVMDAFGSSELPAISSPLQADEYGGEDEDDFM